MSYRTAAQSFEHQSRMFSEFQMNGNSNKRGQTVSQVQFDSGEGRTGWYDMTAYDDSGEWYVDAVQGKGVRVLVLRQLCLIQLNCLQSGDIQKMHQWRQMPRRLLDICISGLMRALMLSSG